MSKFVVARDRDAWGIIRGYVYQVDLTIQRWLALEPEYSLQLECGEDIDLISRAHQSDEAEGQRLLEQVKYREHSITLRTDECVEAIANAIEHQVTNPDVGIVFRFTTNARIGIERLSLRPRIAAISVWERLRSGKLQQTEVGPALQRILAVLQDRVDRDDKPDKLHTNTWNTFKDFIANIDNDQLLRLIKNFEWSTEGPHSGDMAPRLQLLLSDHNAHDEHEAKELYYRLFLFVFKLLCQPGPKLLTTSERDLQFQAPTLSAADHAQLQAVKAGLNALSDRMTRVEHNLLLQQEAVINLTDRVRTLALPDNSTATFGHMITPPMLDLPPLVEHLSRRGETARDLINHINQYGWTAIHGGSGSGKSQLAALVVHENGNCPAWIRFQNVGTTEEGCRLLDEVCTILSGLPPQQDWEAWYSQLCETIGPGKIMVLDDLPRLKSGEPLAERLLRLSQVGYRKKVHLLSTSNHSLPTGLQQRLRKGTLMPLACPHLTDSEAAEILQAYGAPLDNIEPRFTHTVNLLTQRHPQLLAAAARYMSERGWRWTGTAFESLLRSQYAETINDETLGRLLETVEDSQSRELLYRLNVPFGAFSQDMVQVLAAVEPVVDHSRERLMAIMGLWVQRDANELLSVSPLIKTIGSAGLPQDRLFSCHSVVGDRIMQQGKLSPLDLSSAVTHFGAARDYERAGAILAWSLGQLQMLADAEHGIVDMDLGNLLSFWWDVPLPSEMSLFLRLNLRTQQIAAGDAAGRDVSKLIPDLVGLTEQATQAEAIALLAAVGVAGQAIAQHDFALACRLTVRALSLLPHARLPDGSPLDFPLPSSSFIWLYPMQINSLDHIRQWMDMVGQIESTQRTLCFTDHLADEGCVILADRAWMIEAAKPQEEQAWGPVLDVLRDLEHQALDLDLQTLWACAIRAQISVRAEFCKDLPSAVSAAHSALERVVSNTDALFLIKEAVGRTCGYARNFGEAAFWLEEALTGTGDSHPMTRFRALLEAAWFTGSQALDKSFGYLRQAIEMGKTMDDLPETEIVKALGELAIAHHLNNDNAASFQAFDEAAERLYKCREDTENWKALLVVFGSVAGYLSPMSRYRYPPQEMANDDGPYKAPQRGQFLRYTPAMAATLYKPVKDLVIPELMAKFAEAIGRHERAAAWSLEGIRVTQEAGQPSLTSLSAITALPYLLAQNRFADALDVLHSTAPALLASEQDGGDENAPIEMDLDVEAILGSKDSDGWRRAENITAELGLIPAFMRVSTVSVEDASAAVGYAAEVAVACQQISKASVAVSFWVEAADLINEVFARRSSSASFMAKGEQWETSGLRELAIISFIGGTLQIDAKIEDDIVVHIRVAQSLITAFKSMPTLHHSIILPFFYNYWVNAFSRSRFRFATPRLTEQKIAEVAQEPLDRRVQVLLRSIAEGLRTRLPDWARGWLYDQDAAGMD